MCKKHFFLPKEMQKSTPKANKKTFFARAKTIMQNVLIIGGSFVILFQFDVYFATCFFISSFSSCVFFYKTFLARLIASIIFIYIVVPKIGFVRCQIKILVLKCIQYQ